MKIEHGTITLTAHRPEASTITVTFPDHVSADQYVEEFKAFMLALGFHPDTVRNALNEDAP